MHAGEMRERVNEEMHSSASSFTLCRRFVSQGHEVIATSRSDYSDIAQSIGVEFYR